MDSQTSHNGGIAQLADELGRQPSGSVAVLEGDSGGRLRLAQEIARHLGYGSDLRADRGWDLNAVMAANNPHGILFFDEASSLFGSRTDVKDSHDRYANLFDQLPSFRGLLLIGADTRHSILTYLLAKAKVVSVRDYWPPR
jgi:hypothetical protein